MSDCQVKCQCQFGLQVVREGEQNLQGSRKPHKSLKG